MHFNFFLHFHFFTFYHWPDGVKNTAKWKLMIYWVKNLLTWYRILVRYILESWKRQNFKLTSKFLENDLTHFFLIWYELDKYVFLLSHAIIFWISARNNTRRKLHFCSTGSRFSKFLENNFHSILPKVPSIKSSA